MRKLYLTRFYGRLLVAAAAVLLIRVNPAVYDTAARGGFFAMWSPLHLLWTIWLIDLLSQLFPAGRVTALGSRKLFAREFRPPVPPRVPDSQALRREDRSAALVFLLWGGIVAAVGMLYYNGIFDTAAVVLSCVFFYVCDLFCVLFWCPFRALFLHNRCCTTCRIFNWDHLMMLSPLVFLNSFFGWTLVLPSLAVFLQWEITRLRRPERFREESNDALRCKNCSEHLCGRC